MISITLMHAVRKGQGGHFTCGITLDKWSVPAANEVAQ